MSYIDLQSTLRDWPYDPDQISVRKVLGTDGQVRIQMRVELGLLQMELEGRPDGERPFGCDSLLSHHRVRLTAHEERNGTPLGFVLQPKECLALRNEASLFYRRYVALFVLEEFEAVFRDTGHNLGVFDLCRDYGLEEDDRTCLEPFRAYVLMMDARARAYQAMQAGDPASALAHVNRGMTHIRSHFEVRGDGEAAAQSEEMRILLALGTELAGRVPEDSLVVTQRALRSAIRQERFEEAARLRDAIRNRYRRAG